MGLHAGPYIHAVESYRVPFNRPTTAADQGKYIDEALRNGRIAGDGPFTNACQDLLAAELGAERVLLTTSCTHALELAATLLDVGPGDEVIVPSFTFVSTANAFAVRGARPRFADVCADTLNIDPDHVRALAGPNTRAIVPVHYAGVACDMDEIEAVATAHDASVVEDNAHGLFGSYRGRMLGTLGRLGTLSFHDTKNFTCGEGGALIINDPTLIARAEIVREKGTDRSRFFRGEVDKYTWVDFGSSYLPSDILAAVLLAQLEERERIQTCRAETWHAYRDALADWAATFEVRLPVVPPDRDPTYHLFFLLMPTEASRDALISHLRERGILAVFHYLPLHLSPMGRRFGGMPGACPVSEAVSSQLLRLPLFTDISGEQRDLVIRAVLEFRPSR